MNNILSTKTIALIVVMSALANVLGYISIPLGTTKIHFMQLPIIFTALALGSIPGAAVGFIGAATMAFTLATPNPYILPGNALLGFFTGLFYSKLKNRKKPIIIPQIISLLGAIAIHFPYVYITDVYFMSMPSSLVLSIIIPKLFLEDIISLIIAYIILFRVKV